MGFKKPNLKKKNVSAQFETCVLANACWLQSIFVFSAQEGR